MPWFEYTRLHGTPRPFARVVLWHGNRQVPLIGLVDSGADSSLLDVQYAIRLGLDTADATREKSAGAGGNEFETLSWPASQLELQFDKERFPFEGKFVDSTNVDITNLLGRKDFFRRFVIQFWDSEGLMNIDLNSDFAEAPLS